MTDERTGGARLSALEMLARLEAAKVDSQTAHAVFGRLLRADALEIDARDMQAEISALHRQMSAQADVVEMANRRVRSLAKSKRACVAQTFILGAVIGAGAVTILNLIL